MRDARRIVLATLAAFSPPMTRAQIAPPTPVRIGDPRSKLGETDERYKLPDLTNSYSGTSYDTGAIPAPEIVQVPGAKPVVLGFYNDPAWKAFERAHISALVHDRQ